ncbi:MAG: glycosyltransferase family 4 protein [Hylemonella sp.]
MSPESHVGVGIHLAIDASNIRQGGGVTHLSQMLAAADPQAAGISQVTVWAPRSTVAQLPARPWLTTTSPSWVEAGLARRLLGQQMLLSRELLRRGCHVLFSPGGTIPARPGVPVVTMSQNLLPFEPIEAARFGRWSLMRFKMWLLRRAQGRSFRNADGVIFLTQYAQETVCRWIGGLDGRSTRIPHGIERRFLLTPRRQRPAGNLSLPEPFTVLYVSILMPYKHQIEVAQAVSDLRQEGVAIRAKFLGSDWGRYGSEFRDTVRQLDPAGEYLFWPGGAPYEDLHQEYGSADAFVFASSCENLPNILIEAMAAGLPIACSDRGPMPEVLGDAGVYFDPDRSASIAQALRQLVDNVALREQMAASAWRRSQDYSWEQCARETFAYIGAIAMQGRKARAGAEMGKHVR